METDTMSVGGEVLTPYITEEGLTAFLSSRYIKGIGAVYAKKIVGKFGLQLLDMEFEFGEKLRQIPGLGESKIREVVESVGALPLSFSGMAFLYSAGLSDSDIEKIIGHYKKKTLEIILADPYDMVENAWKVSFFTADKIGRLLNFAADDPRRLRGAILTAVKFYAEKGNMFATEEQTVTTACRLTGALPEDVSRELNYLVREERLVKSDDGFYLPVYFNAEKEAAEKLSEIILNSPREENIFDLPTTDIYGNPLTDGQLEALKTVIENPVTIITGGPGTGKTTLIRGLIRIFEDMDRKVILAAPTGRAAKRMSDLSGAEASTIHRLLGYRMGRGYRNKSFDADILIIDEASMLEQVLFNHLLQAMKTGTKVVLVGDTGQLPAIGAGDVLNQMIESGTIPVVNLTENFRQKEGSGIALSAENIKKGESPENISAEDFVTVASDGVRDIKSRIVTLLTKELPEIYKIEPKDVGIVTPQQEGPLGAKQLNMDLQDIINPDSPEIKRGVKRFKLGDRVMQTANDSARNVYNGETGWISALDPESQTFEVTFKDGKKLTYGKEKFRDLTLAYATTVHKLQGSETDYMILLMTLAHRQMLYRNLLYTGVSRAKKLCVILGESKALRMAVDSTPDSARNSAFKDMLRKELKSLKGVKEEKGSNT